MQRQLVYALKAALVILLAACQGPIMPETTIVLPEGDPEQGKGAFVELQCTSCHVVSGVELPAPVAEGPIRYTLGGAVTRIRSYDELVTSVVNPSHRLARSFRQEELTQDGQSLMPALNDVMTVTQLVDIVAFLQQHFSVKPRPTYRYPTYGQDSDRD